jgi:rifampin ADP-ribosylating transferase
MTYAIDAAPPFYHGTRADLKPGELIAPGYSSNYGKRKQASWVYLTGTLEAAILGGGAGRR